MRVISSRDEMGKVARELRDEGRTLVFVPTMGALHEGHQALFHAGKKLGDVVIASLFVNPTQFNDPQDFEKYPRDTLGDLKKCQHEKVDIVFTPSVTDMYPDGSNVRVNPQSLPEVAKKLEGASRPGHFEGVISVVSRLFEATLPHKAIFGLKDYQQLLVILEMAKQRKFDIEIWGHPIVRSAEGLALSSRNERLTAEGKTTALHLSQALREAQKSYAAGERKVATLVELVKTHLEGIEGLTVDYVSLIDAKTLESKTTITQTAILAIAAFIDGVRLIDNTLLGEPDFIHIVDKEFS